MIMIDWLCRIFYTVLSMGILGICLLPPMLIIRFLMGSYEKRHMLWQWRLIYLRCICPIAMSSLFCLVPSWNRQFHLFLAGLGLTIENSNGIMQGWGAVFQNSISTTPGFRGCSITWAVGVFTVLFCTLIQSHKLHASLKDARLLGENIYESTVLRTPVYIGILSPRIYVPAGFLPAEMTWLLRHAQAHRFDRLRRTLVVLITALHWFNPVMWLYYYMWSQDEEMDFDDRTVRGKGIKIRQQYAQGILNFYRDKKPSLLSLLSSGERHTTKRARRMMYQEWDTGKKQITAFLLLSLMVFLCFFMLPLRMAIAGDSWGQQPPAKEEPLFGRQQAAVIAKANTQSPEGLDRILQLEMTEGQEAGSAYTGHFLLKMYDSMQNEITSLDTEELFASLGEQIRFPKALALCIGDYNGDTAKELVLGQKTTLTQKDLEGMAAGQDLNLEEYQVYRYSIVGIEDKSLTILSDGMYAITDQSGDLESVPLELLEGSKDIIVIPVGKEKNYYGWNSEQNMYQKRELTEEEVENYRNGTAASQREDTEHTLRNIDGSTAVLVTAKKEEGAKEEDIQSVILSPGTEPKSFRDIRGYYCDLLWVPGDEENRYAVLIYNGINTRTFTIYDVEDKSVYFAQPDNTEALAELFEQYNEKDITFTENTAIYSLQQKEKDILQIRFTAAADNNKMITGQYEYDVIGKRTRNLTFEQIDGEPELETEAPDIAPETEPEQAQYTPEAEPVPTQKGLDTTREPLPTVPSPTGKAKGLIGAGATKTP